MGVTTTSQNTNLQRTSSFTKSAKVSSDSCSRNSKIDGKSIELIYYFTKYFSVTKDNMGW